MDQGAVLQKQLIGEQAGQIQISQFIAAIVAANATHLTPVISTFTRFFFASWGLLNLGIICRLEDVMFIVLMLNLLYGFAIYRHALTSHAFFIQQALLEEQSSRLAEQFRQAKEEAEQALLDKNQFLTTASHDLRQPVHAMGFLIEAIIHKNRDDSLTPQLLDLQQSVRSVRLEDRKKKEAEEKANQPPAEEDADPDSLASN